jgi:BirA family biotin operon repressor/biotin-[acetyl-CoA-carboxylase] ligase
MTELPAIFFHSTVESTNDIALDASADVALHGACWAADRQTAGRGRREVGGQRRSWFSPEHANLYMSVLLRPDIAPSRASGLTLASAAGVCTRLRELTGLDIWVKWPNDLYVGSKKVAGILSEALTDADGLESVVVGLGINVNVEAEQVPDELVDIMTSFRIEAGRVFDRLRLLAAVRDVVVDYTDRYVGQGYASFIDELRAFDRTDGRDVSVSQNGEWVDAVSRGISDEGGLRVEIDGAIEVVQAGEVRFR